MTAPHDVIVAGLGAMGSAAAWHLAARGARVLGLDAHRPPHRHGSHHGESRIIRTAYFEHPAYVPLLERAIVAWAQLGERSGRDLQRLTGGLMIGRDAGRLVAGTLASVRTHGLPHELLTSRELAARYPMLTVDPDMVAVWEARAGILRPEACIEAMLDAARINGAELRFEAPVLEWRPTAEGVEVTTAQGVHRAGALVLAAGTGMGALVTELSTALVVERQVYAHFVPDGDGADLGAQRLPIFCVDEADGRFYYGVPDLGAGCKIGRHHGGAVGASDTLACEVTGDDLAELHAFLARRLPSAGGRVAASGVCRYTNTPDLQFVLDRHPRAGNVIVASVCSGHGFKFAAVVGEIVADLLRGTTPAFDLSIFAMARLMPAAIGA